MNAIRAMQIAPKTTSNVIDNYTPKHKFEDFAISDRLKLNIEYKTGSCTPAEAFQNPIKYNR